MIIGTVSYDPDKVLYAEIKLERGKWVLVITQSISDSGAIDLEVEYDEHEDAVEALCEVDTAITEARDKADKSVKVGFTSAEGVPIVVQSCDDDEQERIGFDS